MAPLTRRSLLGTAVACGIAASAGCSIPASSSDSTSSPVDPYFSGIEVCNNGTETNTFQLRVTRDGGTLLDETFELALPSAGITCRTFNSDVIAGVPVEGTAVSIRIGDGEWQTADPELPTDNESMECVLLHVEAHPDELDATHWVPARCPDPSDPS